jgi:hypothetical protein
MRIVAEASGGELVLETKSDWAIVVMFMVVVVLRGWSGRPRGDWERHFG